MPSGYIKRTDFDKFKKRSSIAQIANLLKIVHQILAIYKN